MIEVAASDQGEPRIEVCRICHFLWFDADELAGLARLPPTGTAAEPELSPEARKALAIAEVELMGRHAERDDVAEDFWIQMARIFAATRE